MMADLETPSDCVTVLFDHDGLHQGHVGEHGAVVDLGQSDIESDRNSSSEPSAKRMREEEEETFTETITIDWNDDNVKQTLYNVNRALSLRLDELESKYEMLLKTVQAQNAKLNAHTDKPGSQRGSRGSAVVVGLPQPNGSSPAPTVRNAFTTPGGNVTLITLNNEDDYPNGVWLGDEHNPELRVRVPITPSDLLHIHSNCRTPEKMSLTLLDYLFDRDTQAMSNLSGTGKHGKAQLDPLKIYGIRCHLIHRFQITEQDWHRFRLNIDSKCRTAYRRKVRGQPLTVKGFKEAKEDQEQFIQYTTSNLDDSQLHIQEGLSLDGSGELQIIHATEEQLVQLQQSHQIQILDDNQVPAELLQHLQDQAGSGGNNRLQITVAPISQPVEYDDASEQLQVNEIAGTEDGTESSQHDDL